MTMHDLLDDLAAEAPQVDGSRAAVRAWRVAARRRSRRWVVGASSVAAAVVLVSALVGIQSRVSSDHSPPADQPLVPGEGIPSQIHDVHRWLATIGSRPVPPVTYVYALPDALRPIALSVDGSYRYLPKRPGDAKGGELSSYAVSPDGLHLAVAWSPSRGSEAATDVRAQLYVYDLATGGRRGPWLGQGRGSSITELAWRWDDQGLAWEEFRPVAPDGSFGTSRVVVLDWGAGTSNDLDGYIGPVAWSPDGTRVVATRAEVGPGFSGLEVVPVDGSVPTPLGVESVAPVAWSADGRTVAVVQLCDPSVSDASAEPLCGSVVTVDATTGETTGTRPLSAFGHGATLLGWRDGSPVVAAGRASTSSADLTGTPFVVAEVLASGSTREVTVSTLPINERTAAQRLLDTAPVVDLPAPNQPRFGPVWWAYAWERKPAAVVLFWLVVAPLLLFVSRAALRRWRTTR